MRNDQELPESIARRILRRTLAPALVFLLTSTLAATGVRAAPSSEAAQLVSSVLSERKAEPWRFTSEGFVAGERYLPAPGALGQTGAVYVDRTRGLLYGLERGARNLIWEVDPSTHRWRVVADQGDRTIRGIAADPDMDGLLTGFTASNGNLGLLRINPRTGMTMELGFDPAAFQGLKRPDPDTRLHVLGAGQTGVVALLEGGSAVAGLYVLDIGSRTAVHVGRVKTSLAD